MRKRSGYFHNIDTSKIGGIDWYESDPSSEYNGNYNGPFKTFAAAKRDAIKRLQFEIICARELIRETKKLKNKPENRGKS